MRSHTLSRVINIFKYIITKKRAVALNTFLYLLIGRAASVAHTYTIIYLRFLFSIYNIKFFFLLLLFLDGIIFHSRYFETKIIAELLFLFL